MKDKQLFEKISGGYIPIYPLTKLKNIIDDNNSINLSDILQLYNHIYVTKQDTIEETRLLIPTYLRRFGLWISYEDSDGIHTEWFTGSNIDSQDDYKWSNNSNWEIVPNLNYVNSAASRIPNGAIIPEMLSPALQDFLGKHHNIINFVDDEDLTELQSHIIKFKDKDYKPYLASGKGYKILRKNWINGINVLSEDNINSDNTIYEVRYDFDLKGTTINLSENTSLWFKGGSINNGTINFNGGTIIGKHSFEECGNANFTGKFTKGLIMFIEETIKYYDGEDWKEFAVTGDINLSNLGADVKEVTTTEDTATADVVIEDNKLRFSFGIPRGEKGEQGPAGSQGVSGIPGVSIELRYCLGTESSYDGNSSPSGDNPSEWSTSIPKTTEEKPYVWCIQGRRVYSSANDDTGTINWSSPFRLSGTNGLNGTSGADGKRGQLIYPAGVYNNTTSYTTDENTAPYVLDNTDGNFYVLNAQMTWKGSEQENKTPSQDFTTNKGKYWLKFDVFEAIYAKIGIIANGLIGSAVFNGDYMFSQQGINPSSFNAITSNYEEFNPEHIYDGTFTPNILIDFKSGIAHLASGDIKISINGTWWKGDSWETGEDDSWKGGLLYANTIFKIPTNQPFPDEADIVLPYIPEGYYGRYIIPLNKNGENRKLGGRGVMMSWKYINSDGSQIGADYNGNVGPTLQYPPDTPQYAYAECIGYRTDSLTTVWLIRNISF